MESRSSSVQVLRDRLWVIAGVTRTLIVARERSHEHLEQIEAAVDPFDLRRLADAAHSLKSSSAQMGAARLADQCNRVEQLARTGGTSRWIEDVAEIRRDRTLVG